MSLLRRMTSGRVQDAERALRKGDFARAIAVMEAALKRNPEDVKGRRQLADTYAKAGRFEDALRELLALGDAFAREGLRLKATSAYKAALDIDPDHEATKAALAALQESRASGIAEALAEGALAEGPPPSDDFEVLSAEDIVDEIEEAGELVEADDLVEEVVDAGEAAVEPSEPGASLDESPAENEGEEEVLSLDAEEADDLIVAETASDEDEIDRSTLPEMPLFAELPVHAFHELVSDLDGWRVPAGATLVREGEMGQSCFVIVSGEVRVERGGEVLATLGAGDLFGEIALVSDSPRAASIVAAEPCELFEIKRARLEDIMGRYPSVERVLHRFCRERLLANVVRSSRLFDGLDERLVREIIRAFRTRKVRMGERVVAQGDKGRGLFVVLGGELDVSREESGVVRTISQLRPGDVFGEMSLLFKEPASATVMALQNGTLLALSRRGFDGFVQRHPVMKRRLEALAKERRASHDVSAE